MAGSVQIPILKLIKEEKKFSVEEYYRKENKSIHKHEYHSGNIFRTPSKTTKYSRLSISISSIIGNFEEKMALDYIIFDSQIKIRVEALNQILYSSVSVFLGKVEYFDEDKTTLTNPILIVDVLSPNWKNYDKVNKFNLYRTIPSFNEYVLIDQDTEKVSVFTKQPNGDWLLKDYIGRDATAILVAIHNCPISLAALYQGTENL